MFKPQQHLVTAVLLGSGVLAWTLAGQPLVKRADLNVPLNPLGINGSPYGEVFAMAMQGPIDTHFHGAMEEGGHHHHDHSDHGHTHASGHHHDECPQSSSGNLHGLLTSMQQAVETRTNPKPASEGHKRYLRRQVEDKLRFAYHLDPSHYANYNSLHFFLTEPQLGTRPELTPSAAKLAEETIHYCLSRNDDPRPALTAASATTNILELMFNDHNKEQPRFTTAQMRQYLGLLDHCIGRFYSISEDWKKSKNWDLLSPQRIGECNDRIAFILKFREAADGTILRFEGKAHPSQVSN